MEELWKGVPEFPLFKNLSLEDKPILDLAFKQFSPLISGIHLYQPLHLATCLSDKDLPPEKLPLSFGRKPGPSLFSFPPSEREMW